MLLLSVLGVSDEEIIADYVLSDNAYKEIGDKKAMVASLKQVRYNTNAIYCCYYVSYLSVYILFTMYYLYLS